MIEGFRRRERERTLSGAHGTLRARKNALDVSTQFMTESVARSQARLNSELEGTLGEDSQAAVILSRLLQVFSCPSLSLRKGGRLKTQLCCTDKGSHLFSGVQVDQIQLRIMALQAALKEMGSDVSLPAPHHLSSACATSTRAGASCACVHRRV